MPLLGGLMLASNHGASTPGFTGSVSDSSSEEWPLGPDAVAGFRILADGRITTVAGGPTERWDNGIGTLNKADYQFRVDTTLGSMTEGDGTDVWLAASGSDHYHAIRESGLGVLNYSGTLRVRLAVAPFTEYDTTPVTLLADRTP